MKQVYFLSGLPRSGSTLLGSIMSQRPDMIVTPTSPVLDLLCSLNDTLQSCKKFYTYNYALDPKLYASIANTFFDQYEEEIVVDKHRGWPKNVIPATECITPFPKIICTYRPISDVITSYLKLIKAQEGNNFIDDDLRKMGLSITIENRAERLWSAYISDPYNSLQYGLAHHKEHLYLVHYDELMNEPKRVMANIYNFLGLDGYTHDYNNIKNACAESKDVAWGLDGLHEIRPNLRKTSTPSLDILGPFLTKKYNSYNINP